LAVMDSQSNCYRDLFFKVAHHFARAFTHTSLQRVIINNTNIHKGI
jgi:hypothetical protein